jgi:hypothetical protein
VFPVKNVVYESGFRFWSNVSLPHQFQTEIDTNDELVLEVNGITHTIKIPEGKYETHYSMFTSTLTDTINQLLIDNDIPVRAKLGGIHDDNPRAVLVFETAEVSEDVESVTINSIGGTVVEVAQIVSPEPVVITQPIPLPPTKIIMPNLHSSLSIRGHNWMDMASTISVPSGNNSDIEGEMKISVSALVSKISVGILGRSDFQAHLTVVE